jgi:hypothetical protein
MALVMALTLLALLGIAIAGGLAHTVASQRAATLSQNAALLDAAADRALSIMLGSAGSYGLPTLKLGERRVFTMDGPDAPEVSSSIAVTRLHGGVLWIVAVVTSRRDSLARRRVNLVARFPVVGSPPPAALVSRGSLHLGDDVRFSADTTQDADCEAAVGAAVIVAPGASVRVPAGVRVDTSAAAGDSSTFFLTQRQLSSLSNASGVVRVAGDTIIAGGAFEGILIVDGSLSLRGTVAMTGLIIVRGGVDASDATVSLHGALLVYAAPSDVSTILTAASVEYSPCIVARVMRVALSPRVVRLRSWAELF